MEAISKRLREALILRGMRQSELADRAGIGKSSISTYLAGTYEPKQRNIYRMAKVLNVSEAWLMGADVPMEPAKLEEGRAGSGKQVPLGLPEEAQQVALEYSRLDRPGKNVVQAVIAEEGKRVAAERLSRRNAPAVSAEPKPEVETRLIPLYYTPAAAGLTEPAAGQDFDYIEVGGEIPQKADCAVRIDGDSMEPYILDGSTVYVTRGPLENGDVGIFYLDGDMLCKQYYKDEEGNVRLLSLNRSRADADRFIHHKDTDTVMMYYGRVILPHRPAISWE